MQRTVTQNPSITSLIAKISSSNPDLTRLVRTLLRLPTDLGIDRKKIFETPTDKDFEPIRDLTKSSVEIPQSLVWTATKSCFNTHKILPIRAFRGELSRVWSAVDKLRIFLSSGTTSGPEGRSRSGFSPEGTLFYQGASLATFFEVLESLVQPFCDDILNTRILSLIPTVDEWPDSSLAQMLGWFSEVWPVDYVDAERPDQLRALIEAHTAADPGRPVVIFGTAFHFVNLFDDGQRFALPVGSIIVETGGTKGKSRSVTRQELYDLLGERFCVNAGQIVSEYGMCELASQGWDFVPRGKSSTLSERRFRFPWWVKLGVMTTTSDVTSTGHGALTIYDPLRVDLADVAIQTEDLAAVEADGSLQLLGRVPRAPLKGCSLRAETVSEVSSADLKTHSKSVGPMIHCDPKVFASRAPKARRWFVDLLSDRKAFDCLAQELRSERMAQDAISDLASGLPFDAQGFVTAAVNAANGQSLPQAWLFIPPASHSLAAIQPLAAAFTMGLKVRVRLPAIQNMATDQTFLARAIELGMAAGFEVIALPNSWRLGADDLQDGEGVLVFGDDETVSFFKQFAPGRVSGFGNAVCVGVTSGPELNESDHVRQVIKDLLNLRQRGCLSARALIVMGGDPDLVLERLLASMPSWITSIDPGTGELCARSMEFIRLSQAQFHLGPESLPVTVAAKKSSTASLARDFAAALSRLDLVISVICLPESTSLTSVIDTLNSLVPLRAVAASDHMHEKLVKPEITGNSSNKFSLVRSGTLGAPRFDGLHLGRQFFAVEE